MVAKAKIASTKRSNATRFYQPRKKRQVRRTTIYLTDDIAEKLAIWAAKNDWTVSEVVEASLKKALSRKP
jgi:L-lactate utilization protein LutC